MNLIQLIYVSSATHELAAEEIRRILDTAVRHNSRQEVTGMLLYVEGSFMQVLEGEEAAVEETISRIVQDPRHHSILVVSKTKVAAREFGTWAMGFRGITADDAASWPGYAPFFDHGFSAEKIGAKPGLALEILQALATRS